MVVFRFKMVEGKIEVPLGKKIPCGKGSLLFEKPKESYQVSRYNGDGIISYRTTIQKNGEWRADPIRCYRIVKSEEEKSPIRGLLRKFEIPISVFHRHQFGEELKIQAPYDEGRGGPPPQYFDKHADVFTDGAVKEVTVTFWVLRSRFFPEYFRKNLLC